MKKGANMMYKKYKTLNNLARCLNGALCMVFKIKKRLESSKNHVCAEP